MALVMVVACGGPSPAWEGDFEVVIKGVGSCADLDYCWTRSTIRTPNELELADHAGTETYVLTDEEMAQVTEVVTSHEFEDALQAQECPPMSDGGVTIELHRPNQQTLTAVVNQQPA